MPTDPSVRPSTHPPFVPRPANNFRYNKMDWKFKKSAKNSDSNIFSSFAFVIILWHEVDTKRIEINFIKLYICIFLCCSKKNKYLLPIGYSHSFFHFSNPLCNNLDTATEHQYIAKSGIHYQVYWGAINTQIIFQSWAGAERGATSAACTSQKYQNQTIIQFLYWASAIEKKIFFSFRSNTKIDNYGVWYEEMYYSYTKYIHTYVVRRICIQLFR